MTVDVRLVLKRPSFTLDVDFHSEARLIALFGASGSGKSTLVNMIAGLVKPTQGRIAIDGRVLYESASGLSLPAYRRRIGYVFQDARLFPHLTVRQNLRYGRWFCSRHLRYTQFSQLIALLGIENLLEKMPQHLSGGEQQRVAIGRALLASPELLLMDEPLSSLDEARKQEILPYIERLRDELHIPILYVTHSVAEVSRLAGDMVVLSHGKLVGSGPTPLVMQQLDLLTPDDPQEGRSLLDMEIAGYDVRYNITQLTAPSGTAYVPGFHGEKGKQVRIAIRGRDVMLSLVPPQNISALNCFKGTLAEVAEVDSSSLRVMIKSDGISLVALITRLSGSLLKLELGQEIYAITKSVSLGNNSF